MPNSKGLVSRALFRCTERYSFFFRQRVKVHVVQYSSRDEIRSNSSWDGLVLLGFRRNNCQHFANLLQAGLNLNPPIQLRGDSGLSP